MCFHNIFRQQNHRRISTQTIMVQSNLHNAKYKNPKPNEVQDQNSKNFIGSEIEKKVPVIQETVVPSNPIANQPTFGYLKLSFFQVL